VIVHHKLVLDVKHFRVHETRLDRNALYLNCQVIHAVHGAAADVAEAACSPNVTRDIITRTQRWSIQSPSF
jgi:hypothetical protein